MGEQLAVHAVLDMAVFRRAGLWRAGLWQAGLWQAGLWQAGFAVMLAAAALFSLGGGSGAQAQTRVAPGIFEGVASCAGSTCHGRIEGDGKVVRQDELSRWQEPSSPSGAHSRAFTALEGRRGRQIAASLGLGEATGAPACLGCHAMAVPIPARGARFQISDGVGCEACHGASSGWIASHYAVGASHAANVAGGLLRLEDADTRARLCLDCHVGSGKAGHFVSHQMMAAGHPRLSFELDLFSAMQAHYNLDAAYARRKGNPDAVRLWAVGQARAVQRSLDLFGRADLAGHGMFPEFTFYDCHSCHRRIYDAPDRGPGLVTNPERPIPFGTPPFNDENIITLAAVARVMAPDAAAGFERVAREFHAGMAQGRGPAVAAAARLNAAAGVLAMRLARSPVSGDTAFTVIATIAGKAIAPRFTDYEGSVQAVMAVDTLLNALVRQGRISVGAAAGIRASINRAYEAVHDANAYQPAAFRAALAQAAASIEALR